MKILPMSKCFQIVYPIGGGGTWLNATIAKLENYDLVLPVKQADDTFENNLKSASCLVKHHYNFNPAEAELDRDNPDVFLFSIDRPFNHYIQMVYKIFYNSSPQFMLDYIGDQLLVDQFFKLSDHARHLNSEWYSNIYCNTTTIDLDQGLIFTDPLAFVEQLFNLLDRYQIVYNKDKEFCRSCVELYKSSQVKPELVYNNFDNIAWLGWCHALSLLNDINIPFNFSNANNIQELSKGLLPFRNRFLELTENKIYKWQ